MATGKPSEGINTPSDMSKVYSFLLAGGQRSEDSESGVGHWPEEARDAQERGCPSRIPEASLCICVICILGLQRGPRDSTSRGRPGSKGGNWQEHAREAGRRNGRAEGTGCEVKGIIPLTCAENETTALMLGTQAGRGPVPTCPGQLTSKARS